MGNKVIYVRSNPVSPDSRVEKEVEVLTKGSWDVTVLAWGRYGKNRKVSENKNGYYIVRIPLAAPLGSKVIPFIPLWWFFELIWLLSHQYDIIHAADFDTYIPALIVAKLRKKKIIYDIYDHYAERIVCKPIHDFIWKIDNYFMKFADSIIVVDSCRLNLLPQPYLKKVELIYNSPNDLTDVTNNNELPTTDLSIFYGGIFTPYRDILSMIKVVKDIDHCKFVIAGGGPNALVENICDEIKGCPNISYVGMLPYSQILSYSIKADLLFALYDPIIPNNRFASPNKLFEAMMLGKPIIVNEGTAATDKVREENCGLVVPYGDVDALKKAVLKLKNSPQLRKELGENGRRAYEIKYSWSIMEKRLLDLYKSLV